MLAGEILISFAVYYFTRRPCRTEPSVLPQLAIHLSLYHVYKLQKIDCSIQYDHYN